MATGRRAELLQTLELSLSLSQVCGKVAALETADTSICTRTSASRTRISTRRRHSLIRQLESERE